MEEGASKGEDAPNNDKSPPKKARFDEQQPSTSGSTSTLAPSDRAATDSNSKGNGENARDNIEEPGAANEEAPAFSSAHQLDILDIPEATTSNNQRWQRVVSGLTGDRENERNSDTASTSTNGTVEVAENAPVVANIAAESELNRSIRELHRFRQRVRQLAYESIFGTNFDQEQHPYDDDSSDDSDLPIPRRNPAVNIVAELADPPRLLAAADSSDDSSDPPNRNAASNANMGQAAAMMEYDSEDSSNDSFSDSSSNSMSTSSAESDGGSTESETALEDFQVDCEVVDYRNLHCLKLNSVQKDWTILREIRQREHGLPLRTTSTRGGNVQYNPSLFQKRAYGSLHMMQRLSLLHRLEQHTGCVNSLSFNRSGKLLASGSDDLHVNLWHWESKKLLKSIASGHRSNVFQTKFMEHKGYDEELEIISTGRDGQVRHTRVDPSGRATTELLFRGHMPIHKIAIPSRNECSFLTVGEDGKVRMYDLRQGKQEMLKKVKWPLYSIATHPYDPEFCVAGSDMFIRVYDIRNTKKALKLFNSQRNKERNTSQGVTCAVYNETGTEILASHSDDDIYLYDNSINHQTMGKPISQFQGHCNIQTIKGVNFFGPRSEFVVSGSDCGYIFIWDKQSQVIVNWMNGDRRGAVNCLEPHPEFPILATSGVDNDVKIWIPKGPDENQIVPLFAFHDLKRNVRRNISDRRERHFPRNLLHLARPAMSQYFSHNASNSTRDRVGQEFLPYDRHRFNNAQRDNDMDAHQRLRCNPS